MRFFVSNWYFTTDYVINVQNSRFFSGFLIFSQIQGFSCLNCQILGFSIFPGKQATL